MQSNVQIQVAARIKELMKENNLNQVGLAAKTGIKQNTISAWLLEKKRAEHKKPVAARRLFQRGHRLSGGQKGLLIFQCRSLGSTSRLSQLRITKSKADNPSQSASGAAATG